MKETEVTAGHPSLAADPGSPRFPPWSLCLLRLLVPSDSRVLQPVTMIADRNNIKRDRFILGL